MLENARIKEHVEAAMKLADEDPERLGMVRFHLANIIAELDHLEELAATPPAQPE